MTRSMRATLSLAVLATPVLVLPFATVGWKLHNIHGGICRDAAKSLGISGKSLDRIIEANRDQDLKEVHKHNLHPNERYDPAHHFDRNAGETDEAAFRRAAVYVSERKRAAIEKFRAGDDGAGSRAEGQGSHALQDLFSHSNMIRLSSVDQAAVLQAVDNPGAPVPAGLRLTGYDRKSGGSIKGDEFSHDRYNLDGKDALGRESKESKSEYDKSGHSCHKQAYDQAVLATRDFLRQIRQESGLDKK